MSNPASTIPLVDLVIVIDTSPSMKDEAQALSDAAQSAIASAKSSCPSALREDATRALEDISDYFDWRKGAAKAIFYLGDEALEGGGSKTTQKDVEAANLAIQKAKAAEVKVHTYFGTSKSRYHQTLISEYARVADETGGRAFTHQDTISGFSAVLEQVICGSRISKTTELLSGFSQKGEIMSAQSSTPQITELLSGTVYIQDYVANEKSKLYTLDLATGKATFIGEISTEVNDIAFVDAQLYGLKQDANQTQLVKIDLNSKNTTVIGNIGFAAVGLDYNPQRKTLYASTAKQLIAINLETGKGNPVVTVAGRDYNCGEVAFDADGKAYITLIGYDKKKLLARCNLDTGEVKPLGDIGFPNIASIDFIDDVLYGITGDFFNLGKNGQLIRINTATGKGSFVVTTEPIGRWAGIATYQPIIPEQSTQTSQITPSQKDKTIKENDMSLLTIDTKNNCYVINSDGMNHLQQNVANSLTLSQGTYQIKISSGRYKYAKSKTQGEPSVLLWIYGVDSSTFINKNTGCEVGAT